MADFKTPCGLLPWSRAVSRMGLSNADKGQRWADYRLGLRGIFYGRGLGRCHVGCWSHPWPDSSV